MRKWGIAIAFVLLLTGCGSQETLEKVEDEYAQPVMQEVRQIRLSVGDDALVLQGDAGTLYLCNGYTVTTEVLSAGDIGGTMRSLTGFDDSGLTVMQTMSEEFKFYECAWSAATEEGEQVGRAVILDDGIYHYCVTVMADAADFSDLQETLQTILDSVVIL